MTQKFPPSCRLHYQREYRRFFNQSEAFRLSECLILRIPNDFGHYRLGITIKASARSIDRNRVKRQIREFFRSHPDGHGSYDYNVIVSGRKTIEFPFPNRLRACLLKWRGL